MISALKEKILKFLPKVGYYVSSDSVYDEKQKAKLSDLLNNKDDNAGDSKQHIRINGEYVSTYALEGTITFIKLNITLDDYYNLIHSDEGEFDGIIDVYVDDVLVLSANPLLHYLDKGVSDSDNNVYAWVINSFVITSDTQATDRVDDTINATINISNVDLYIINFLRWYYTFYVFSATQFSTVPICSIYEQDEYDVNDIIDIEHPIIYSTKYPDYKLKFRFLIEFAENIEF